MSTYAIGDIQGCREQLERLLARINFDPAQDCMWLAGDLVNRGPDSLGTLRLLYSLRDSIKVVLGNHDLHLLAASYFTDFASKKDTFFDVINAPDAERLLGWLRMQPLLQESEKFIMCHAGIHPNWTLDTARILAKEAEAGYQANDPSGFFRGMYGNLPEYWDTELQGIERLRFITNVFTRMRYCDASGALKMHYKAAIADAPEGLLPWFEVGELSWSNKTLLIGHWAALQIKQPRENLICLDSGCVWGNTLSAYCFETSRWTEVPGL